MLSALLPWFGRNHHGKPAENEGKDALISTAFILDIDIWVVKNTIFKAFCKYKRREKRRDSYGRSKERLTTSISTAELERRWKAVRKMMRKNKIDYLVMRQDEEFLGGYVKWFSDFSARHSYPFTIIFPVDDEMTFITCGGFPPAEPGFPPQWAVRGVKKRLGAPYFESVHYTSTYDAELAVGVLKEKKQATIGWVGKSYIPVTFYEYLRKHLAGRKLWMPRNGSIRSRSLRAQRR